MMKRTEALNIAGLKVKKKQNKQDYPINQITFWDLQSLIDEAQWEDY